MTDPAQPDPDGQDDGVRLITQVGDALNRSSYPVPLTRQVIGDISRSYRCEVDTALFATYLITVDRSTSQIAMTRTGGAFRFDQIAATESLVHKLRHGTVPVHTARERLRAIVAAPPPLHPAIRVLGYALMALGFALCFRMSVPATVAAVAISIPAAIVLLWSATQGTLATLMPFLLTFVSALLIALWAIHGGTEDPVRLAVIPVVALIPGAALATALIELTAGDMITGATRLISAVVMLLSMAFGLALAINIVGMPSYNLQDITSTQAPHWVLWLAAPVFGVGNILYLCTPRRMWGWTILFAFCTFWLNNGLQSVIDPPFAGGVALGVALLAARAVNAYVKGHPNMLVMFLPAFWLMVPGSMGFVAMSGTIVEDHELGDLGENAALSLLSMAICMMVAGVLAPRLARKLEHRHHGPDGAAG